MSIRKLRAGRVPGVSASEYVGTHGTIFYDEVLGTLRISDGVTPYGNPLTLVGDDFNFTFGDFLATTPENGHATLSSTHTNQSIDIRSNGTGEINLVGQFNVFDAQGVFGDQPIFRVKADGQIRMLVPLADSTTGALEVIGNTLGASAAPNQTGVILHVTGNDGLVSRNYFDAANNYALIVGRRYNGTASNNSPVLNGEMFFRIAGQASNDNGFETFGPIQLDFVATQDQTPTHQGGEFRIRATPNDTTSQAGGVTVATFNATTGVTATKFNGPLTGNVTGTADIATTVTLVATNTTDATHYLTFVDSATGNENVRTDTGLTYNPSSNVLTAGRGTFTQFSGKFIRNVRDAGTVADGGTLTIDFTTDAVVHCVWGNGMTLAYQNYLAGSVVRICARKATGTGVDNISLDGIPAANVSTGSTTTGNYSADTTNFIELTCIGTTINDVYIKL